ncbi:alpha/beta fold hydrolase [Campylobacter sp.]|uniref:alpha/beta fold hydrolase n=1 Tax=Campylobacter sp. TaxID=205 RepID=UPI002A827C56|nr:alpha/beta fold hydrolase [Campylobacter sp.]MDY4445247.1 alpha/beta hydrolase [Campylobacter sp.]
MKNQNISLNEVKNSAFLANASYGNVGGDKKDDLPNLGETITNPATNSSFEVYNQADNDSSGFSATVFKDTSTGEYVIAFRGTEFPDEFSISKIAEFGKDAWNDVKMPFGSNDQMDSARAYTQKMIKEILEKDPNAKIIVAGHSLGGTIAQQIAYEFDEVQSAVTVNAYGSARLIKNQKNYDEEKYKANENKIINVVNLPDAIVRMEEQYGNTYFLNNNKESIYLSDISHLSFSAGVIPSFVAVVYAEYLDHSIDNNLGYINELNSLSQLTPLSGPVVREQMKYLNIPTNHIDAYKQKQYVDFAGALKYFNEDGSVNFAQFLADTANISLYQPYDPIALDLNANGKIDTLTLENGVFFDHNGDEIAFKSSWISGGDGILARDINGDNEINSGAELFGNFTRLKNGELAKNGAEALKDLDDNNDGIIYSNDKEFNEILIWQDKNSDGISQKNELKTLREHGIKSINLEFLDDNTALDKDNKQILIGSFKISSSVNSVKIST